jgi:hypothetical protein
LDNYKLLCAKTEHCFIASDHVIDPPADPITFPWSLLQRGKTSAEGYYSEKEFVENLLFMRESERATHLTPGWKIVYRTKPNGGSLFLCTDWAIFRGRAIFQGNKQQQFTLDPGEPLDSTDFSVQEFIDHLLQVEHFPLEPCDADDAEAVRSPLTYQKQRS